MSTRNFPARTFKQIGMAVMIGAAMIMGACSGGSSSTSSGTTTSEEISALSLPDRIELSNVEDNSGAAVKALGLTRAAYSDAGTDYSQAEKHSWVDDTDALDMVNDILGVVKDTGYASFVNEGAYKALVRQVGESEQSQSGSSTTSTTTEELMEIYVNVTRESNDAPMIVKVWVEEEDGPGDSPMLIRGYFTVTQGVSDNYPYGVMTAHFKGTALNNDGSEGEQMFTMAMSVNADGGNVIIENVEDSEEGGGFEFHRKVRVVANEDVTQGNAYVSTQETNWDSMTLPDPTVLQIVFNDTHFKATDQESSVSQVFAKNDLRHRVFRYQLFNADTGAAVSLNSGFPIETSDGKNGYVGYYGLWTPNGTTLEHGATVYDMNDNSYTVFRSSGKLTKHTSATMSLGDLTGMELSKWTDEGDKIVTWDGSQFNIIGSRNDNGQIVYADGGTTTFQQWEGAWCEGLKAYLRLGNVCYNENGTVRTPSDSDTVYYHTETTVDPNDAADMTLYTWSFTLNNPITQAVVDNAATAQGAYWMTTPTEKVFTFNATNMMLYDAYDTQVTLSDELNLDGTDLQWGYHISPLTTDRYTESNHWQANEAQTYYSWNTGTDEWNQYVTLVDDNNAFISFDAPLSFTYTHSQANDVNNDSTFEGKTFRLEYDGFSVNVPWEFDDDSDEWQPLINIKDGTVMGETDQYVIKGIEEALIMSVVDGTGITFVGEENVGEPSLTYDATKTAQVGDVPTTAQLKVIKGELIE